jgi:small-conductance mechanosensitive channel
MYGLLTVYNPTHRQARSKRQNYYGFITLKERMTMKTHKYFITIKLITGFIACSLTVHAAQPLRTSGLALVGTVELRTNQRDALAQEQAALHQRNNQALKDTATLLQTLTHDLEEAKKKLHTASPQEAELFNKKITIIYDRRQNLREYQEQWATLLRLIQTHRTLVEEIITYLSSPHTVHKPVYPWKEMYEACLHQAEAEAHIEYDTKKRDNVIAQRAAASDLLSWLEKQIDKKAKEYNDFTAKLDRTQHDPTIEEQGDILAHELNALKEKLLSTRLTIEELDRERKLRDDIIDLENNRFDDQKALLARMEKRLVLEQRDIAHTRLEKQEEERKALAIKEEINQEKESKKHTRDQYIKEAESFQHELAELKEKKIKGVSYILAKTHYRCVVAKILALDKELQLLEAKKELANDKAQEKGLQLTMAEIYYKLRSKPEKIESLLTEFYNKRELAINTRATLHDRLRATQTASTELNRSLERIKNLSHKVRHQRPKAFKDNDSVYRHVLKLLDQTRKMLYQGLGHTQTLLAAQADLIAQQTKIIHHYDLIIKSLEKRRVYSVWQRSPDAISLASLSRAALEAETFFTKLYWETPQHLSPSALINTLRSLGWHTWLLLLICLIIYLGIHIVLKRGLLKIETILDHHQAPLQTLYLPVVRAFIHFAREHFTLLYTWLFIFMHIAFKFKYIFAALAPLADPYTRALFFLISIPIWVYLVGCFIHTFKELNRQLSFVFFAESFQEKFIHLITILCYATAIIIPLRLALLSCTDATSSEFATVLLAAYSLTMLVVFALFFAKADVLKFIPPSHSFFIWVKRKIDRYYYPVFLFFMGILILSNRYVGYPALAWFLIFAVTTTVFLSYILLSAHAYVRKQAIYLFMKEEDDEVIDKFEHAKAYYGFFIIFSFALFAFFAFVLFTRIWGLNYSLSDLWRLLAEKWVIQVDVETKIGVIQFMILGLFITGGFLISSFLNKSIFNRLFDILHTDLGTQNTISRIAHYFIVFLAIILGLSFIQLKQLIFWVGAPFTIGLGLALKDIAFDFIGGFFVLIDRPIEIGNYVQIDNIQGTVQKIAARSTTLLTSRNHSIIIPNKDLVTKWIVNWGHGRFAVGFEINVRVEHGSDPELVKQVLTTVLQSNPLILKVPAVVVRLEDIDDIALCFLTRAFISARRVKDQWEVAAQLRGEILKTFKTHRIVLAKPARVVEFTSRDDAPVKAIDITFDR